MKTLKRQIKNFLKKVKLRWIAAVALLTLYLPVLAGVLWPMIWYLFMISPALYQLLYWWWTPLESIFPQSTYFLSGYLQVGQWAHSPLYGLAPYIVAFGTAIFLASLVQVVIAKVRKRGLVTSGLYGVVRHPQHLGIAILTFGFIMWNEIGIRVGDLVAWTLIVFSYILLAEREEESLQKAYGEDYLRYKRRVSFMLPFLPSLYGRLPKILPSKGWRRRFILIGLYGVFLTTLIILLVNMQAEHIRAIKFF